MPESAYEKARRHSGSNDWAYGEKYNALGEFNPRMSACADCGEYKEPEEMDGDLCPECSLEDMRATQAEEQRRQRHSGI